MRFAYDTTLPVVSCETSDTQSPCQDGVLLRRKVKSWTTRQAFWRTGCVLWYTNFSLLVAGRSHLYRYLARPFIFIHYISLQEGKELYRNRSVYSGTSLLTSVDSIKILLEWHQRVLNYWLTSSVRKLWKAIPHSEQPFQFIREAGSNLAIFGHRRLATQSLICFTNF